MAVLPSLDMADIQGIDKVCKWIFRCQLFYDISQMEWRNVVWTELVLISLTFDSNLTMSERAFHRSALNKSEKVEGTHYIRKFSLKAPFS